MTVYRLLVKDQKGQMRMKSGVSEQVFRLVYDGLRHSVQETLFEQEIGILRVLAIEINFEVGLPV